MPRLLRRSMIWTGAGALALLIAPTRAPGQCQVAKLLPDGRDGAGWSVAVHGDVALVGAPGESQIASASGAVYVFRQVGSRWVREAKLVASDARRETVFGWSAAVEGDRALIGTPYGDGPAWFTGAAYRFERVGGEWFEIEKLNPLDPWEGAFFGASLALDGDTAVVGRPHDSQRGAEAGAAYVFERDANGIWTQTAKLLANDAHFGDNLGHSVAVDGDVIVLGAPNAAPLGNWSGAAYVFERVGGVWAQTAKLVASDGGTAETFGTSTAVSGQVVLIGAPWAYNNQGRGGAVYVFEPDGNGQWSEADKLVAADGHTSQGFASAIAFDGRVAVVGAPNDSLRQTLAGAVYVLVRTTSVNWSEIGKLYADDVAAGDKFGYSVALSGEYAVIGAPFDDDMGTDSGSAYVFALDPDFCECLAADLDNDAVIGLGDLGILLSDFGCLPPATCPGDIDNDGDTDLADLGILLARFGEVCQ